MIRLIIFILLCITMLIQSCKNIETTNLEEIPCGTINYDSLGNIVFKKICSEEDVFFIDSIFSNGIEINRIFEPKYEIQHYYLNDKNRYLKYSFILKDRNLFSIERRPDNFEKVSGNNTVILNKRINKDNALDSILLYIAYPLFTQIVTISLLEITPKAITKRVIPESIVKKHKTIIEYNLNYNNKYFFETKLLLNSGKTYLFITPLW